MYKKSNGFVLPTVVIVGTVLFAVMAVILGSSSSTRTVLDAQFYEALARDAAESGTVHVRECMSATGFTSGITLTPATNCAGVVQSGQSSYLQNNTTAAPKFRTTYTAAISQSDATGKAASVTGRVELLRTNGNGVWRTYDAVSRLQTTLKVDQLDRVTQRFWCFGNGAGLDFGMSGTAVTQASASCNTNASEGVTVVTDKNGVLKFSSDGLDIYDSAGTKMPGSTGMLGAASSTQAVAAFPLNSSQTRYGVVSNTGQVESGLGELYLNVVDMNERGGLGDVTSINTRLGAGYNLGTNSAASPTPSNYHYSSEAMNAMPNADGTGYYVYTFNPTPASVQAGKQGMLGFLIKNDLSIATAPVFQPFSPAPSQCITIPPSNGNISAYGYGTINFSSDYSRMLVLVGTQSCADFSNGTAYLYSTNRSTGALTLLASWTTKYGDTPRSDSGYSADFSPNEKYVYVSQIYHGALTRYDISNLNSATIKASEWSIISPLTTQTRMSTVNPTYGAEYASGGQIRRGPNGKMYIADHAYCGYDSSYQNMYPSPISVINNPDSPIETISGIGLALNSVQIGTASKGASCWGLPQTATVYTPEIVIY